MLITAIQITEHMMCEDWAEKTDICRTPLGAQIAVKAAGRF